MGNKIRAREAMAKAGLPMLPGSKGVLRDAREAEKLAESIGYPVILKAAAGGGGRGMKIVRDRAQLRQSLATGQAEAAASFGSPDMFLERYVEEPRHIEIQIVADNYGSVVHLGERECSVQRRHQKLIEESPSAALDENKRQRIGKLAVEAMKKVGYANLGTLEFLMDERGQFHFMEMNTRIQVEHPVTEQVTGIDLVREQIRLAAGEKLGRTQKSIQLTGHAIECRINAEDPVTFAPSPGRITGYHVPGGYGVRIDSGVYEQYVVPPYYDSLLAKLIAFGDTRQIAIARMRRALGELVVEGIKTNIPFQRQVLDAPAFVAGKYDTRLVDQILSEPKGPRLVAL
jgi:acetyl-CoA carboxylase biotin carboxylase subunit